VRDHRSRPGLLFPQLKADLRAELTRTRDAVVRIALGQRAGDRRSSNAGLNQRIRDIFRFYSINSSARPARARRTMTVGVELIGRSVYLRETPIAR
jgi:hypothetical protein